MSAMSNENGFGWGILGNHLAPFISNGQQPDEQASRLTLALADPQAEQKYQESLQSRRKLVTGVHQTSAGKELSFNGAVAPADIYVQGEYGLYLLHTDSVPDNGKPYIFIDLVSDSLVRVGALIRESSETWAWYNLKRLDLEGEGDMVHVHDTTLSEWGLIKQIISKVEEKLAEQMGSLTFDGSQAARE